jgi:D-alanyl-D-alanine-carboxypeptidase/D-alanyl-D-alanine-endopeptidase
MPQRNIFLFAMAMVLASAAAFAQAPPAAPMPSDAEIHKILADRIGAENLGIGMVVGIVDAKGRRIIAYGSLAKDDKRPLNGDTVYEIGSMTKVFTSLVLMDMARKEEVSLTDPVSKYLPATVKVPERNGKKITLQDLSTQSSGLPRLPTNFTPKDQANPYADYTPEKLYEFLSSYQLTRDIGSQYEYSNVGVGLLGQALTQRAGSDYETMVRSRILEPLGMNNTRVKLTQEMQARLAIGHGAALSVAPNWDLDALAGAGALRSSANDMLTFLAANLGYTKTPLAAAMEEEVSIRRPAGSPDMQIAYAWHIQTKNGNSIVWHNGGTGGYRSYMGFNPATRVGVVVLSNSSTDAAPDDVGRHLLDASYPLDKVEPIKEHKEITIDTKVFDNYVGTYQLAPSAIMTISRDGYQFFTQLTGQGKIQIYPESDRKFFLKLVDAQLTFDTDAQGKATQVTLHQNGRDMPAKRIDEAQAAASVAALEKKFKDQTPDPRSEATVRRLIDELRAGEPKYELMTPAFADLTRQQLTQLKATVTQLGAVESVTFKGVEQVGADIYDVKFEHGSMEWSVMLNSDGKVAGVRLRPL